MTFQQYIEGASKLSQFDMFDVQPDAGAFRVCINHQGLMQTFLVYKSDEIVDAYNAMELFRRLKAAEPRLFAA